MIRKAGLPVSGLTLATKDVVETMYFDKKVKGGRLRCSAGQDQAG